MSLPARFSDLKRDIAAAYPNFEERATRAWIEIIEQLKDVTTDIVNNGPEVRAHFQMISLFLTGFIQYIPQVKFSDLETLGEEEIDRIKQRGCVVIQDIVDNTEAMNWKGSLEDYIKANPGLDGEPSLAPLLPHLLMCVLIDNQDTLQIN